MIRFVFYLIISFISTLGVTYVYIKFLNVNNYFRMKRILLFLGGVLFLTLVRYFDIIFLKDISFFIFYPLMFYVLKPLELKRLVYYVICIWLFGMILDLLTMLLVSIFLTIFNYDIENNISWVAAFLTLFVFLGMILIAHNDRLNKFINKYSLLFTRIKHFDLSLVIFSAFILLLGITILINLNELSLNIVLILFLISLIADFYMLVKFKIFDIENEKFLNILKSNNEFYIKVEEDNRIFKHNLMAKLLSIKSVSNKKSRVLIDDMLINFNSNVDFINHMNDIPYGLNGVVYQKIYPYLGNVHIKIDNRINCDIFNVLTPRRYNVLVEKLVIALDNALESSVKSIEKLIVLNMYETNMEVIVEVKNSFSGNINLDEIGNKNYSTKGKKRGLGLFSSFRDKEAILNVKIINNMFISRISARKK